MSSEDFNLLPARCPMLASESVNGTNPSRQLTSRHDVSDRHILQRRALEQLVRKVVGRTGPTCRPRRSPQRKRKRRSSRTGRTSSHRSLFMKKKSLKTTRAKRKMKLTLTPKHLKEQDRNAKIIQPLQHPPTKHLVTPPKTPKPNQQRSTKSSFTSSRPPPSNNAAQTSNQKLSPNSATYTDPGFKLTPPASLHPSPNSSAQPSSLAPSPTLWVIAPYVQS